MTQPTTALSTSDRSYAFLDSFQRQAFKFAIYPNAGANLLYPVVGLLGECKEYELSFVANDHEAYSTDEAGDVLWNAAAICTELGLSLSDAVRLALSDENRSLTQDLLGDRLVDVALSLTDFAHKYVRDAAAAPVEQLDRYRSQIALIVGRVVKWIDAAEQSSGHGLFALERVCDRNLSKLRDRQARNVLHGSGGDR